MIIVFFLGLIFSCESNKNEELLEEKEPKIVYSLMIFVPGDQKISRHTIGNKSLVYLSEDLLPPMEEVKKLNIKNQDTSTKTLNNKVNSLYMLLKNIWWHLKDYKFNSHTVMDKFFGAKNQDKLD